MFPRSQFRNNPAIPGMCIQLRSNHA
jgi:hypothetical protein